MQTGVNARQNLHKQFGLHQKVYHITETKRHTLHSNMSTIFTTNTLAFFVSHYLDCVCQVLTMEFRVWTAYLQCERVFMPTTVLIIDPISTFWTSFGRFSHFMHGEWTPLNPNKYCPGYYRSWWVHTGQWNQNASKEARYELELVHKTYYNIPTLWLKKPGPVTSSNSCTGYDPTSVIFGLENRQRVFSLQVSNWRVLMKLGTSFVFFAWQ